MPDSATQHTEFNIREYWQILVRRRWMIYTAVLVATLAATVMSFIATPLYRSTCSVSIERSGVRLLRNDLATAEPSWLDYQNFYNTQYRIIQSERVLRGAVDILGLRSRGLPGGAGKPSLLAQFKDQIARTVSRSSVPAAPEDEYYPFIRFLEGGLSVEPVRDSHLVQITFVSSDRRFAAEAANAIARAYTEFTLGSKLDLAKQSEKFFIKQIEQLRDEIRKGEDSLQQFARSKGLVTGDANEAALKNYEDLRLRLTQAKGDLGAASGRYRAYQSATPESLEEVRTNSLVQQLGSAAAEADREYREKAATYGSEYPDVVKARSRLQATLEKLEAERQALARQVIEAARTEYESRARQVEELQRLFDATMASVDRFQGPYNEYVTRKRVIDAQRTTLNEMLDKQNQMALSASLGETGTGHNVRVIDEAQPARMIWKPKKKLNIGLGLLFGLLVGVGAAVLAEYIDNTLKTPDDVRANLGLAVLGMIPAPEGTPGDGLRMGRAESRPAAPGDAEPALVTLHSPLSPIAEAYRELRTSVLLSLPGHQIRDITVTSCQPSEGKTTTAINLAITLAQLGRRVLLVDTDLRRPRCHQVLNISNSRGVSTYLTGATELAGLVQPTLAERIWLLPAGPIPPNPAELLDADRFRQLVAELRASRDFDHVVFDSAPVLSVVDPLIVGRQTEGTVLVVKSAFTSRESGRLGRDKLVSSRVNLLGVVLNAVSAEHVPYQYRYYRYGYSNEERASEESTTPAEHTGTARGA